MKRMSCLICHIITGAYYNRRKTFVQNSCITIKGICKRTWNEGLVAQVQMGNQTKSDDEKKNTATKKKKKRTENCYFSPKLCLPGVSPPVLDLPCMCLHCCCLHSSFKIKSCTNQNPLQSCKAILDPMVPNFAHFFRLHSTWQMKHRLQHKKKIDIALETSWPKT
jgi:hypothetical protein